jgi:hypothetical protein
MEEQQTQNQKIEKEKKRWWQYRSIGREEAGKTALLGLSGAIFCSLLLGESLIGDIFGLIFWIGVIIWIVKSIQLKFKK